ncbi:hypothetical protein ACHAWF_007695 [Thalassiosira exigua]
MEEKFRTIKRTNFAFTKQLGSVPGGSDLMIAAGFRLQRKGMEEYYVLTPSGDAWPRLKDARREVRKALSDEDGGLGASNGSNEVIVLGLPTAAEENMRSTALTRGTCAGRSTRSIFRYKEESAMKRMRSVQRLLDRVSEETTTGDHTEWRSLQQSEDREHAG